MLAKPQTFMNLSGTSVAPLMEKHSVRRSLLYYDELDLPWTALRIKPKGSAAGHQRHGIRDRSLGTQDLRVRMGIHPGHQPEWHGVCAGADEALAERGIGRAGRPCGRCGSVP